MWPHGRLPVALLALCFVVVHAAGTARGAEPLTLGEIATLRSQKQNPGQIIRTAKVRGRDFAVDETARERLQELGFSATAIAALAKTKEVAAPDALPANGGAVDAAEQPDPDADRIDRIVKETVANAGVPMTAWEGTCGRVFSGPNVPPQLATDARQVETQIVAAFPRAFVAGIDRRAVNVLIVGSRSEYAMLLDVLAKAGEGHGVRYANEEGRSLKDVGAGRPALYLHGVTTICLEGLVPEHARRAVAHAVGYHAIESASRGHVGNALAGGFGNVAEVLLFKTPGTTVTGGYADRQIGGAEAWPELVRQRFNEQRIRGLGPTLAGSFSTMEMPDYAEAWSLTSLLCMSPKKFADAVTAMRRGTEPAKAIVDTYGGDESVIVKEWQQRALAR